MGSIISRSLALTDVLYFFLGLCYVGRYYGAFVGLPEYAHSKWRIIFTTFLLSLDCILMLLTTLYFKVVTADTLPLEIAGVVINIIAIVGIVWLPESPEYLYSM